MKTIPNLAGHTLLDTLSVWKITTNLTVDVKEEITKVSLIQQSRHVDKIKLFF